MMNIVLTNKSSITTCLVKHQSLSNCSLQTYFLKLVWTSHIAWEYWPDNCEYCWIVK